MAEFKTSVQAGISPVEFWDLTPYLTRQAIPALVDKATTECWMTAALSRAKKVPKLNEMLSRSEKPKPVDLEEKMKGLFKIHNARKGKK